MGGRVVGSYKFYELSPVRSNIANCDYSDLAEIVNTCTVKNNTAGSGPGSV